MNTAIIPKFLFEKEDIIYLKNKGIKLEEGLQRIGNTKVPCYRFYNITEMEVFDEMRNPIHEGSSNLESERNSYAQRVSSILFIRIRQANQIKDIDQKVIAACALLDAVNSLALINIQYGKRFISLIRSIC